MRRNALKIKYWPQTVTIVVWVYICGSGMNQLINRGNRRLQ